MSHKPKNVARAPAGDTVERDIAKAQSTAERTEQAGSPNRLVIGLVLVAVLAFFFYLLGNARSNRSADQPLPAVMEYHEPGDQARAEIAGLLSRDRQNINLDDVYQRAEQFRADGAVADAYILYFFAARKGHGASAMRLAMMSDPAYNQDYRDVISEPDLFQSMKWYRVAKAAGVADADASLQALNALILQRAEQGDPQAKRLLLLGAEQ